MVRLKACDDIANFFSLKRFNSKMVRLKAVDKIQRREI